MRLAVEDLAFGYPGKPVGEGVTFALEAGEILCLLGPNGGGKTTLFKTILRLLEPRGGVVRADGDSIAGWTRPQLARTFGYVPQAQFTGFPFSVLEVVLMGRTAHVGPFSVPSRGDRAAAAAALALLGIGHLAERAYTEVSGGERQLALIARALAQEPRVLVMDEPTASLDFGNQVRVLGEVERLAGRGIGVVFSSHDPDQAFLLAHRVAVLSRGRLVGLGPPADVITRESLAAIYGVAVDVVSIARPGGGAARVCVPSLAQAGGILRGP